MKLRHFIERVMERLGWVPERDNVPKMALDSRDRAIDGYIEMVGKFQEEIRGLRAACVSLDGQLKEARRPIIVAPHRDGGGRIMLVVSR